ncbi:Bacterial type II secretion system protein F domain [marine gamma proteobacterium HTCC2148]|jgi:general secretion pathway protein F|nr:Bacterial type II secretion system protein F domain [marine gamma proteobacterium HTCC2148]MBT5005624.1 type II secretion system F family protein [Halieaceae bacterium]MBT6125568.1 type II secretion system F family protein [Halieaceae bacterium]MBT7719195.1 type II secretion system F family protein [Halieaceae bacterium]
MASFTYKAVGRDGKTRQGVVEASGQELASRQLRAQGLTLLKLEAGNSLDDPEKIVGKPPSRQEVLSMTSELAVLLRAGLPLDRALKVLIDMAVQPQMQFLLNDLLKAVKGGKALSIAMQSHEKIFGSFYISMVRSGEASGQLSEVLDRLVEYLENAKANRDSVVSALIYPAILLVVAVLSIVLMLGFVVPQFESLFEDMGEALPLLTQMVLSGADFIKSWGWLLLIVIIGGGIVFRNWSSTDQGRTALDKRMLGLPLAGGIVFEFEVSKFARTTGTLLGNGVSLLKAISIAIDTVDNRVIRDALQVLPPAVKGGQRMSIALEESKMFTPMVIQMIRVGEESGSLDKMLLELAKVFDDHVQSGVKRGLALLEPILILTMGFIIAVIIIAILMGILSVNNLAV